MESFIILEDIVFNINCYSYDDALTRIRDIMREESLPVSNLIPLISYCSNFRIKNISIYKHLLQDLIKEKTNVYLTKQDYLMSLLIQDIPNLVTDENGFNFASSCFLSSSFCFNSDFIALIKYSIDFFLCGIVSIEYCSK